MRPVNLIPKDDRRGEGTGGRSGKLPYVLVAGLVLALAVTVMYVTTGSKIDDRKAEVVTLEAQGAAATARVEALAPYTQFAALTEAREATIAQLATSRFDWERVLNELALVLPSDVWLVQLTGTVSPDVQLDGGSSISTRGDVPGPALELIGCATSQDAVAGFVSVLRDIDGVTRVGLQSSALPAGGDQAAGGSEEASAGDDCRTRNFIAQFEIVIAFDEATTAAAGAPGAAPPAPAEPAAADGAAVAETQAEQQQATDSTAKQTERAKAATTIVPGVAR